MLVLSRRRDEAIVLPECAVTVRVLEIRGNAVRLGIQAPDGVTIIREELLDHQPASTPKETAPRPRPLCCPVGMNPPAYHALTSHPTAFIPLDLGLGKPLPR